MVGTTSRIRAAHVRRAHGVHGALRVEPLGGDPTRFRAGLRLHVDGGEATYTVAEARATPEGDVLLTLEGVGDRSAADRLHGAYLSVSADDVRHLGPQEWFVDDLVGLHAVTVGGDPFGTVTDVESYPAHDVLVIKDHNRERRIPMVAAFVAAVDLQACTLTVTPWNEDEA